MSASSIHRPQVTLPLRIESTGKFLPSRAVSAAEIDQRAGMEAGWTLRHTGVQTRYFVSHETAAFMGAQALRQAMGKLGRPDLLISAGATPQQLIPCTSALIARELGWEGVAGWDVNLTCLGFVAALEIAASLLATKKYERIGIVCAEIASKGLNWAEPEAAALLGDGAAAVIVSHSDDSSALLQTALATYPQGAQLTEIRGGGSAQPAKDHIPNVNTADYLFHMDGPGIFRLAAEKIDSFVTHIVGAEPQRWDAVDLIIPHQASLLAIRHLRKRLGIPASKLMEIVQEHGNVIAASLPMALHEAIVQGRLQRGHTVLLLGTSAGFALGAALLRY